MEDDRAVHQLLQQVITLFFKRPSYFASTGEDALGMWEKHSSEIGVLSTDLNLPRMSGKELASRLVRENPNLMVIVSSGRLVDLPQVELKIGRAVFLLPKPFLIPDMKEQVEAAFAACDALSVR